MLDLNFRRSQQWRRSDTLVLPARTKRASHSLFLILLLNILLLVAANAFGSEVTVNLIDAQTNQPIANNEITAYQVDADGALDWHSHRTTDTSGQAVFNLENRALDSTEGGSVYVLRSKVYNGFKSYSGAIPNQPNFDFVVGKVRVVLKNGSVAGLPPLANFDVGIKRLAEDGKYDWYSSATTDEAGLLRLNLPDIDNGQVYKLSARSTVNQTLKYSEPLTGEGDFSFVVGNKPLNVTLVDGVSLVPLGTRRIDVYRLDGAGDKHWYARSETDALGKVSFDLEGLGSGTEFVLRAKVFNDKSSYTNPINHTNDYTFKVGTTVVDVTNGTVTPAQPLVGHKVYIYELSPDGQRTYFAKAYSDTNGFIRIDLPDLNNGKTYLARSKSPTDNNTYYDKVVSVEGVTELVVGSKPLTVKLQDVLTGQSIADKKITVYEILANGDKDWFTHQTTDANGVAVFDLPGLGGAGSDEGADGRQFKLSVYAFDDYKTYSDVLTTAGEFTFNVGSVAVHLKNGAVASQPALANNSLTVMRIEDGKNVWVGSATSDANGTVRLDLPGIGAGVVYRFKSPSTVNGSNKYSDPITAAGNMDFVVGNPGVQVTLSNILTGAAYPQQKVTAYLINAAGERHWYSRYTTDENGSASFDLDDIDAGQTYLFKASKFESGSSYSRVVSAPGSLDFGIGAVPVTLIDKETEQVKTGVKITAYRIDNGQLDWTKSGRTDNAGQLIFDLPGLGEGQRYVFKASSPFAEGKRYYGPVIDGIGALTFYLKQGEYGDLDMTVPAIAIETPLDDIANANGFIVTGMATDNLAVEHVEVAVSDPIKGVHRVMASYDDVSMQWQASILAEWVSVGQTTIVTATAVDYALNTTSNSRDFVITDDTESPVVTITSHQNQDAVNVTGFTVLGTVTDDIDVATITATVTDPVLGQTVIDQPLNISSLSGQWAFPITNGQISNNAQITISLLATDVNGKTTQATLFVNSLQISTNPVQLVQRITFGLTPQLLVRVKRGDDILNEQLNPDSIDDSVFEAQMAAMPIFQGADLRNYLTTYMTYSKKQLREVMAWFWENHFNTNLNTHGFVQYELRENNLFRQHALGNFRDLLASSAKSPAMIRYLNNAQNVAGRANENYAREVMELHTMGVDGGYTADDIAALSRIFTGWHETDGQFAFNDDLHDNDNKTFLGQTVIGAGVAEGEQVLDILSSHQSTASFICSKLVTLFVSDQPVNSLQSQCAAEFLASSGDISAVLRVIFGSQEFAAPQHYRSKVKTPLELMVSTARGFNAQVTPSEFNDELGTMGMRLFEFPAPTGFSEVAEDWLNSNAVLLRMRMVNHAARQSSAAVYIDFRQLLLSEGYSSAEAIVSYLFDLALSSDFTDLEYQLALSILNDQSAFDMNENDADEKLQRLLGTVLSFPGFQYQ